MCGIFGLVTTKSFAIGKLLLEAGIRLSYRGYDTVGIAAEHLARITLLKDAGKILDVDARLHLSSMVGNKGLLQLRWATFGRPSQRNSQPHFNCDRSMVGAHNGNILNTHELNKRFQIEGHTIRSENDGEVCVHAVEEFLRLGEDPITALRHAASILQGSYSFAFSREGENKIYVIKQGISLALGVGDNMTFVSSDLPCLLPLTKNILRIQDNEIAELSPSGIRLFSVETGEELHRSIEVVNETIQCQDKAGFPHFMLKEIHEQPMRVRNLLQSLVGTRAYETFVETLSRSKRAFFVAAGTSYHACLGASYVFNQIAHVSVVACIASSFIEAYGWSLDADTAVVVVSQSGETKDVVNVLHYVREFGEIPILAIVNVFKSTIMTLSDNTLLLRSGFEVSVPATKTYMNQMALFYYLCCSVGEKRGTLTPEFKSECHDFLIGDLPEILTDQLTETPDAVQGIAELLRDNQDLYILGFGLTHGTALEAALKFKEITYSHAEGALAPEFKHGPLSIVTEGFPVLFFIAPKDHLFVTNHIHEVKTRDGTTIVIAEPDATLFEQVSHYIAVPRLPETLKFLGPLVQIIPLQLLAYYSSLLRGFDPDTPRNLSKTLTVD